MQQYSFKYGFKYVFGRSSKYTFLEKKCIQIPCPNQGGELRTPYSYSLFFKADEDIGRGVDELIVEDEESRDQRSTKESLNKIHAEVGNMLLKTKLSLANSFSQCFGSGFESRGTVFGSKRLERNIFM